MVGGEIAPFLVWVGLVVSMDFTSEEDRWNCQRDRIGKWW